MKLRYLAVLAATLTTGLGSGAFASEINRDWEAHRYDDHCYAISFPKQHAERASSRFLTVTDFPADDVDDEIAFQSGFPKESNIEASIRVDGNLPFKLLVYKGVGFMKTTEIEQMVIAQMKAGRNLEVKWTSPDGSYVVDNYSLFGFTASHAYADNCG